MNKSDLERHEAAMDKQNAEFAAVAKLAEEYRNITYTTVVDDDYPQVRFGYEQAVRSLLAALAVNRRMDLEHALAHAPKPNTA